MDSLQRNTLNKKIAIIMTVMLLISTCFAYFGSGAQADTVPSASGKINASSGANLRAEPSTKGKQVAVLKDNAKITINSEVFVKDGSTKATNRWFQITASGKSGYIRSDLVDTISYKETAGSTTDALNYRSGPSSNMSKKGTFKKGSAVTIVLKASLKGSSQTWYKVKVGNNYYFVCADWIKFGAAKKTTAPEKKSASQPATAAKAATTLDMPSLGEDEEELPEEPVITVSDVSHPETLLEGMRFFLKGTVVCDRAMEKAKFGIIDSKGKWIFKETREINGQVFNITAVDAAIRFGTLKTGTYTYRGYVYIKGKAHRVVNYKFIVKKGTGGEKLTATAIALAWPAGTGKSVYHNKPTAAYKAALDTVYPEHNKWKKGARTGASCDVFVGTVCRYSGLDPNMPRTVGTIYEYLPKHPEKWVKIDYTYNESDLRSGDIIVYYYKGNAGKHVCMYVKINGKGYVAEANYPSRYYGFINGSIKKLFRSADKKKFVVYRALGSSSASTAPDPEPEAEAEN